MDLSSISIINLIFINLFVTIFVLGGCVILLEPYLPTFIVQMMRYGKHKFEGKPTEIITRCEMPKSWFKHFYLFAATFSVSILWMAIRTFIQGVPVPELFISFLDILCGSNRRVATNGWITLLALGLITLQCLRRFYETFFIQIFSSKGKINLAQYLVGYFHYFGAILIILSQAQGFVRSSDTKITPNSGGGPLDLLLALPFAAIFLFAWIHQYQSNLILANLRKNPAGVVVTQKHLMPVGGFFEYISSPHMFFEILLYLSLQVILYKNTSWIYVVLWVVSNQIENSWLTHQWYKKTFPNYPKSRRAIIPRVL